VLGLMMKTRGAPGAGVVPWELGIWKSTVFGPSELMLLMTKRSEPAVGLVLSPLSWTVVTTNGSAMEDAVENGEVPLAATVAVAMMTEPLVTLAGTLIEIEDGGGRVVRVPGP